MHRIRKWVRVFFGFSRAETNGFLILLPLMVVSLLSEPVYVWWKSLHPPDFSADAKSLDSLMAQLRWDVPDSLDVQPKKVVHIKFTAFDPNRLSAPEFTQLGMSSRLAERLVHYREKGGVFRKKEDLLKIYGMDSVWYEQARTWITIPQKNKLTGSRWPEKKSVREKEDMNTADSLQLLRIYGIGPALSKRIRTYRNKLGGFVSMDQLTEVYGLDSTVVSRLKTKFRIMENFQPQKINLNTCSIGVLTGHPYFHRREAGAILAFVLQHGKMQSLDQLFEIQLLTREWIVKVRPYLTLEE